MANYFGLGSTNVSTLFSSLGSSNRSTSSLLGDYAAIRNGSYKKLLKAYYNENKTTAEKPKKDKTDKTDSTKTTKLENEKLKTAGASITKLKTDAASLSLADYTEANRSKIEKNISSLVKDYNTMLKDTKDVASSLTQRRSWMTGITSASVSTLESVGITINDDNTLSLDSEKLSNASLTDLKKAFSGTNSYAGQVNSTAGYMAQTVSTKGTSTASSLYTNSGNYNLSNTALLDFFL